MTTAEKAGPGRVRAAYDWVTGRHADRHRLDDPLTERGLFLIGAGIQVWSTWHLVFLASWAYGHWFPGLVNSLFYDAFALLALRVGTDTKYTDGIRTLAWLIAAACFGVTLTGNLIAHHVLDTSGQLLPQFAASMLQRQPYIRDILGSAPVLLLVASLILVALIKAMKRRVIAEDERQAERARKHEEAQRRAQEQAAADRAADDERVRLVAEKEAEEQETRRLEAIASAERARAEAERIRVEGELAVAQAAAPPPPAPNPEPVDDIGGLLATLLEDIPDGTKSDRCRALILACWKRGITPAGADFDKAIGSDGMGRREIRNLTAAGHRPSERTLELVRSSSG